MTIAIPLVTAHGRTRHVLVSLPRIGALLEEGGRYFVIPPLPTPRRSPHRNRRRIAHTGPAGRATRPRCVTGTTAAVIGTHSPNDCASAWSGAASSRFGGAIASSRPSSIGSSVRAEAKLLGKSA